MGDFPDNKFDSIALLDIVKFLEKEIKSFVPDEIFTHFSFDLNVDHRITCQAVKTIFRPMFIKENLKSMSLVLSSTDWVQNSKHVFVPNHYENITKYLNAKNKALKCYNYEMRKFPHSRSYESNN